MKTSQILPSLRACFFLVAALMLVLQQAATLPAQQLPPPWTGVVAEEGIGWGSGTINGGAISDDGRFVTFNSWSAIPGDTNGFFDVFVRDRHTREVTRVSVATDGTQGNHHSIESKLSGDGRHVAFRSCASNLVPGDTNNNCDVFVRDRQLGTTVMVSVGPNGEQTTLNFVETVDLAINGDGRYVVFVAGFPSWNTPAVYLRDRDADGNGTFDEPGTATTTRIDVSTLGSGSLGSPGDPAITRDGRFIAYLAHYMDENMQQLGRRVFLHDRDLGTTIRVDTPEPTIPEEDAWAEGVELSDAGELVYTSDARLLLDDNIDNSADVFVYTFATAQTERLLLTHPGAPPITWVEKPAISADGRYVAFTGYEDPSGNALLNVFAVDRQTGLSYDVSVRADGTLSNEAANASITADGSQIAFVSGNMRAEFGSASVNGGGGVVVAGAVALSLAEVEVPSYGGSFTVDVTAPAGVRWTATLALPDPEPESGAWSQLSTYDGAGAGTIEVVVPPSNTAGDRTLFLWLGSEQVVVTQTAFPEIHFADPYWGGVDGGTEVELYGDGFAPGATVTVGGAAATNVVVDEDGELITFTTPPHAVIEWVPIVVTNPNGKSAELEYGFSYEDVTPPVIEANVSGNLGNNGWRTSDVSIGWSIEDPETEVYVWDCPDVSITNDVASLIAACSAYSGGGGTTVEVEVKRDATPPIVAIAQPQSQSYNQGAQVTIDFECSDDMSGIASCTASQTGLLDTSEYGEFELTVTAIDQAGLETVETVSYWVARPVTAGLSPAAGVYGESTTLTATLAAGGVTFADQEVTFFLDDVAVGTATTSGATGEASLDLPLAGRNAGTYPIRVEYAGDQLNQPASATNVLTVAKATPVVTWDNPDGIVYGTALSATQLNAEADAPGSLTYDPAAGTVLPAGSHQLSVSFAPTDSVNYNPASGSVSLTVAKATPVVTWSDPAGIVYGTALSATQLNASANVAGSFAYAPSAGTVPGAGTHALSVFFTPADPTNYTTAPGGSAITVTAAPLTITTNNASKVYGEALPGFSASGAGLVNGDTLESLNGTLSFSTPATATSAPGDYSVMPNGVSSPNYTIAFSAGTLTVAKASTAMALSSSPNPSGNNQNVVLTAVVSAVAPGAGTATGSVEFRDNGVLLGTAPLVNGVATLTKKFKKGTHPLTATYADSANFNGSSGGTTHVVP